MPTLKPLNKTPQQLTESMLSRFPDPFVEVYRTAVAQFRIGWAKRGLSGSFYKDIKIKTSLIGNWLNEIYELAGGKISLTQSRISDISEWAATNNPLQNSFKHNFEDFALSKELEKGTSTIMEDLSERISGLVNR